jgi:hypothetical protein
MTISLTQIRSPVSQEIADLFRRWADEAERGDIIGFSGVLILTNDNWRAVGVGEGTALKVIGMHHVALNAVVDDLTKSPEKAPA